MTIEEGRRHFGLSVEDLERLSVSGIDMLIDSSVQLAKRTISERTKEYCRKEIHALETLKEYVERRENA